MSYQIIYNPSGTIGTDGHRRKTLVPLFSCVFFIFFILVVKGFWKEGNQALQQIFWTENLKTIEQALTYTVGALKKGETIQTAMETFCRELLNEAEFIG